MLEKVKIQSYVTFVGVPGSGKSATARHIALILHQQGYQILPITDKNKIEDYRDQNNPQVFVIDDVVGIFGLDMAEFNMLMKYQNKMTIPSTSNTKFLMTCREMVFRNEVVSKTHFLSKETNVIHLHSVENALTDKDKLDLLVKYNVDKNILTPQKVSLTSKMFPYLCKLFVNRKEYQHYGPDFFTTPVPCILEVLDGLKTRKSIQYASLVLLMAFQNKLSEELLESNEKNEYEISLNDMKCNFLKRCKVSCSTDSFQFVDALSEMEGTYTKKCGSLFTFIHDNMFEITAYHFGREFPELIMQYMSSDYIANNIKLDAEKNEGKGNQREKIGVHEHSKINLATEKVIDLSIRLKKPEYPMFAERLIRDIEHGEYNNVFGNDLLKHFSVLETFLGVLEKKSFADLFSIFLSDMRKKIKMQNYEHVKHSLHETDFSVWEIHSMLLDDSGLNKKSVRAISWVIFYGHHQILQFLIDRSVRETGNVDCIFRNSFNTDHQTYSVIGHSKSLVCESGSNLENVLKYCKSENGTDTSDEDSEADIDTYNEPVIVEQCRLLCLACVGKDLNSVQILLKHIPKEAINYIIEDEYSCLINEPLIIACKFGHLNIAIELLRAGADANLKAETNTPLTSACKHGHLNVVKELIKSGADVNLKDSYETPLTVACYKGYFEIVKQLLKEGADVNEHNDNHTPLIAACDGGHISIVKELINAGADVNLNYLETFPLLAAYHQENIFEELIKAGADINKQKEDNPLLTIAGSWSEDVSEVQKLIKAGASPNFSDGKKTALIAACLQGHVNTVKELIRAGAKVNLSEENKTPLIVACNEGHMDIVVQLIRSGADVNPRNDSTTPLVAACEKGHFVIVKELIKAGADINLKSRHTEPLLVEEEEMHFDELIEIWATGNRQDTGTTPLIVACENGEMNIIEQLIKGGADVNLNCKYDSPLLAACVEGYLNIVVKLIRSGVDVNPKNGSTPPLIAACKNGYFDIMKELIKAGADINVIGREKESHFAEWDDDCDALRECLIAGNIYLEYESVTPLAAACKNGHLAIIDELIEAGANINLKGGNKALLLNSCDEAYIGIVEELLIAGGHIKQSDDSISPLIAACEHEQLDIMKELVKAGACVNLKSKNKAPLIAACDKDNLTIVQVLINAGADVNLRYQNKTPLIAAFYNGSLEIIEELLNAGADVNLRCENKSPISAAFDGHNLEIVEMLMKKGLVIKFTKNNKALIDACDRGYLCVVKGLLKAGSNVNQNVANQTPLLAACEAGHLYIVKELIKEGADVNKNCGNQTPLTVACFWGETAIVKELIQAGADVNLSNGDQTPLEIACDEENSILVEELMNAGAGLI